MLARPLEIRSSPQAMPAQGSSPPVIPKIANGMSRPLQPSPKMSRPMTRTIRASATQPEAARMSTRAVGLMS